MIGDSIYIKITDFNVARLCIVDEFLPDSGITEYTIHATLAIGSIYVHPFKSENLEEVKAILSGIKADADNGKRPDFDGEWNLSPFPVFRSPEYYRLKIIKDIVDA